MARFNLDDYIDVAERIADFYEEYSEGRIITDLLKYSNDETGKQVQFIVRASLYNGELLLATGLAEESFSNQGANVTSPLENAETSAIGRACANLGMSVMRGGKRQRPSRQEMEKVVRHDESLKQTVSRVQGESLSIPQQTLRKVLREKFGENPIDIKAFMETVLERTVTGYHDVDGGEIDLIFKALAVENANS